jgi:hypothetical protein
MGARRVDAHITELEGQRRELPVLVYEINLLPNRSDGTGNTTKFIIGDETTLNGQTTADNEP